MNQEQLNQIWPGWILVRKLGQGSYGGVYEIQRTLPGGRVERSALKKISIPHSQDEVDSLLAQSVSEKSISEYYHDQLQKLVQEYSMMRQLGDCPNIVACQDLSYLPNGYGWDIYFRMELLQPLKRVIDTQFREMNVIRLGMEVCNALVACGSLNILHRDIKPENILVSERGVFKLGDFGIAKSSEKTQTGTVAGTFGYMAPEVANREHYGSSADIYSLGMVLYWLSNNNTLPFLPLPPQIPTASQRQQALTRRFSGEQLPAPKNGSEEFKKIILKACAFSPAERYHCVTVLRDALKDLYYWKQKQTEQIMEELGLSAGIMGEEDMPKLKQENSFSNAQAIQENASKTEKAKKRKGKGPLVIGILATIVAIAVGALLLLREPVDSETEMPAATESKETSSSAVETEGEAGVTEVTEVAETEETIVAFVFSEATELEREVNVDCTYEINGDGVTITGYSGELPSEAVLPDVLDGVAVTKIGAGAFASNETIKKVLIPDSVIEIGEKAFSGCTKLQNVQLPSGLLQIGQSAFENCSSLSSVALPNGMTTISPWAFANCKRLTQIEIPGSLTALGEWSFSGCTGLNSIEFNEGITSIDNYVFNNCQRLTDVTIPEGVKTIGIGAFSGCTKLEEVSLPQSLRTLSAKAFQDTALTAIHVNPNCSLGDGAVPLGCTIYNVS